MRSIGLIGALAFLVSAATLAAEPPAGVETERLTRSLSQAIADHDDRAVLATLAELKKFTGDLPIPMYLLEANAAYNVGDHARASTAIKAYLNSAASDDPEYSSAMTLSSRIEKGLRAQRLDASVSQILGQMREIPAGDFVMGSNYCRKGDAGRKAFCGIYHASSGDIHGRYYWHADPAHRVHIKAYRLESVTITTEQFNAFAIATGRPTCRRRVGDCFDYATAVEFCKWLSSVTGQNFRLPSEAEWEYAASGARKAAYPNGDCRIDETARDCIFPDATPNPFGIRTDGAELRREMTADCWHDNFAGAPGDGSAWDADKCPGGRRVLKGAVVYRTSFAHRLASDSLPSEHGEDTQDRPADELFTIRVAQSK